MWLPAPEDYPSKRETDEHDASSAHFAALNLSNELVGYVRLVFPDALENFPFQTHCVSILDNVIPRAGAVGRDQSPSWCINAIAGARAKGHRPESHR